MSISAPVSYVVDRAGPEGLSLVGRLLALHKQNARFY